MVFKLQVILPIMEVTKKSKKVAITQLAIGIDSLVTRHLVALEKLAV